MALTNFILTVAGVGAVVLLFRGDVKHSAATFRRNVRQIRQWLEEESSASTSKERGSNYLLVSLFCLISRVVIAWENAADYSTSFKLPSFQIWLSKGSTFGI
ncbi:uncharacterized protein LOC122081710 isoform X1 [Macadamia integrifolia]|uniref:uncharacterized protein LOC122081710 isoform X1 n=1 Tax=Macadamia integrifolia TaxID=60698 RepID=UPI001C4E38B3|nr:uncharacterized protein LOC122081710 isoform X1 [Macadamia integrifolia]